MAYSIPLIRQFRTAGDNDGPAIVLYNNNYVLEQCVDQVPDIYALPGFSSSTGTYDYYSSQFNSVFVIYTRPSLTFMFTGNTHVFTSDTRFLGIMQEIYKIRHDDVLDYRSSRDDQSWERVAQSIRTPIVTYSAATSAVTTAFTMSVLPDQFIKPVDRYTEEMFEDRAEYFMNMRFLFSTSGSTSGATTGTTTGSTTGATSATTITTLSINTIDENGLITTRPYTADTFVLTNDRKSMITRGSWSGETVYGLFFACFQPPSRPIIHFPRVATAITENITTTPTFNFSNVEDGDSFVLQVTYDLTDTGFTNTNAYSGVTDYPREKTDNSLEQTIDKTTGELAEGGSERSTSIKVRRINAPIRPNSLFLYRIGNVKGIQNIFDVDQQVINYSQYYTGATGSVETLRRYVDSLATEDPALANNTSGNQGNGTAVSVKKSRDR